jgi:prophage tail gpP-like protein
MKIKINDKTFFFFNNFVVQMNLDSVASAFSFVARFNPNNVDHKILFKPLSFPKIEVFTDNDVLLLTGEIIDHDFNSQDAPDLVKISGYSKGGVLEDCNIPYSAYPLESNNRNLKEISEKLLKIYSLQLIIDSSVVNDSKLIYAKSVASPTQTIKDYLSQLTAQRNIVLSHNEKGDIVYFRPNTKGLPVISFNSNNTVKMSFNVRGQALFSETTILRQPSPENENLSPVDTIRNSSIGRLRTRVKTLSSGTDTDTSKAVKNELASQLGNLLLTIVIPRFENLRPGYIIEVQNAEIYLYNKTRFIIQSISYSQDNEKDEMTITSVVPEAYTGDAPKEIFV